MTTRRVLTTLLLLLAPVVAVTAALLLRDSVPERVPTHWGTDGVDDTAAFTTYTAIIVVVVGLLALGAVVATWLTRSRPAAAATSMAGWLAWLFALVYLSTLVVARGAEDPYAVDLPWWLVALVLAGSGVAWLGMYALLPPHPDRLRGPVPTLALGDDERVVWVGTARSRPMAWLGVGVFVVGAALVLVEPVVGLLTLPLGVLLWWLHVVTVRVDERGVRAGWGLARWPGRFVALGDVDSAEAQRIEPLEWGGWGHRLSPRGTALVVRRGEGLVLHRVGKGDLAVTVDGADEAAALVNGLVRRAGSDGARSGTAHA